MDFFRSIKNGGFPDVHRAMWTEENIIEIEKKNFLSVVEDICKQSRYPLLALRLFIHIICGIDDDGLVHISARQMSKTLDAHYDTVTKCLKQLRKMEVLRIENDRK